MLDCNISGRAIISNFITDMSLFGETYEQVRRMLNVELPTKDIFTFSFYENLEIKSFLLSNPQNKLFEFVNSTLGPLKEYRHSSRYELYTTLKIYIQKQ